MALKAQTEPDKPPSTTTPPPLVLNLSAATTTPPPLVLNLSAATSSLSPSPTKQFSYDGVTCEFSTNPPQKFVCSICTQLVKDPHLTACCGHEFCEACLEQWNKKSKTGSCPHCRQERFVHILDKQTRREVEEMRVFCSKRVHGCDWEGQVGVARAHQRDCDYTPVKCHDCNVSIPRKNFENHSTSECPFRESKCIYCEREDAYLKVISFVHLAECPGYPMGCPNYCGTTGIKRSELPAHRQSCPLEEIDCPLKSTGCPQRLLRKDLEIHVGSTQTQHLLLLMADFKKTQQQLQTQHRELRELKMFKVTMSEVVERASSSVDQILGKSLTTELAPLRSIRALLGSSGALILNSEHPKISLVLPNFSQLERNQVTSWESLPFFLGAGYKVRLVFLQRPGKLKPGELAAELRLFPGEFDDELRWPCAIDFASIYMYLSPAKEGSDTIVPSKRVQPPFSHLVKGNRCVNVAQCRSPTLYHMLWQTEKVMDALPPYPSAIRGYYLQNDCLTITITWEPPQIAFSKLSLLESGKSEEANRVVGSLGGRELVREGEVSVSTTTAGSSMGGRVFKRYKRR